MKSSTCAMECILTKVHCFSQKRPTFWLAIILTHSIRLRFLAEVLLRKYFPTSPLWCFSITLRNRKPRNCVFSLKHCTLLCRQTHKTFRLSPGRSWITLHSQSDRLYNVCIRQSLPRRAAYSILLSATHMICVYQVCHGVVRCVKDGSWCVILYFYGEMIVN